MVMATTTPKPYVWEWTEDDGTRRQTKIHTTHDDRQVVWCPRYPGDPRPWFDADYAESDASAYFADEDLATLGMPATSWAGFDS